MAGAKKKSLDAPDERVQVEGVSAEIVQLGDAAISRNVFQPGAHCALGGRKLDGGLEDLADLAKFVRTQNADRLRLVHRKIASLAPSLSVPRIEGRKEQHL